MADGLSRNIANSTMTTSSDWLPRSTKSPLNTYGLSVDGRPFCMGTQDVEDTGECIQKHRRTSGASIRGSLSGRLEHSLVLGTFGIGTKTDKEETPTLKDRRVL